MSCFASYNWAFVVGSPLSSNTLALSNIVPCFIECSDVGLVKSNMSRSFFNRTNKQHIVCVRRVFCANTRKLSNLACHLKVYSHFTTRRVREYLVRLDGLQIQRAIFFESKSSTYPLL